MSKFIEVTDAECDGEKCLIQISHIVDIQKRETDTGSLISTTLSSPTSCSVVAETYKEIVALLQSAGCDIIKKSTTVKVKTRADLPTGGCRTPECRAQTFNEEDYCDRCTRIRGQG